MDIKEFAKSISGKEYNYPLFTKEEIETAKENGFVMVHGIGDDLMEFEGAIRDEGTCFDGGEVLFNKHGVCQGEDDRAYHNCINAVWCGMERDERGRQIMWIYKTDIPHETFMIYEDEEPYCRGIVFNVNDVE